jgi:hypothetical protein
MSKKVGLVLALSTTLFVGCPSPPPPNTPPPPPDSGQTVPTSGVCPVLTDPAPSCPGVALTGLTLTCSAPIRVTIDSIRPNRLGGTLANGSTVTGTVRGTPLVVVNEPCHGVGASSPITITLGLEYVGDMGPNAPICIVRSKVTFTQFDVSGGVFNSAWNPTIKAMIQDRVHRQLDQTAVDTLNSAPGAPARCANFQLLP